MNLGQNLRKRHIFLPKKIISLRICGKASLTITMNKSYQDEVLSEAVSEKRGAM